MKLIHKFKSPNYNKRKSNNINLIIIHYTAINSISESISYLCSKKNKVSSHYLISKNGDIYNLVAEKYRAWHAGKSYWSGVKDINSCSIGIELDYNPTNKSSHYTDKLIYSLSILLKNIMQKYEIGPDKILGHSDISPYRKIDPGVNFPWFIFQKKKLAFEIKRIEKKTNLKDYLKKYYVKLELQSQKKKILFMLDYIGYDISLAKTNKLCFSQLIKTYSNRFRFYKNYSYNKNNIFNVIELHFVNLVLTKLK